MTLTIGFAAILNIFLPIGLVRILSPDHNLESDLVTADV